MRLAPLAVPTRLRGNDIEGLCSFWLGARRLDFPALQLGLLFRDPFVEVLSLKIGEVRCKQAGIPLNISSMAQDFGGPQVNHRRHPKRSQIVLSHAWRGSPVGRDRLGSLEVQV